MTGLILLEESLTRSIIGGFYEVYDHLGFGFLEHVYSAALADELTVRGHHVVRELGVNVYYKGKMIAVHRMDMVVDDLVVVENKSSLLLPPTANRQLFNYLKSTKFQVGLLLHFGAKPAFHREIHTHKGMNLSDPPDSA